MNKTLFVRNLSWHVSENDLYDLFGQVGDIVSVRIPTRMEDKKPRGFAFIEMETQDQALEAIRQYDGYSLQGRELSVALQDESKAQTGGASRRDRESHHHDRHSGHDAVVPHAKLFIRNVGYNLSEYDLTTLLEQAGPVISVKIPMDRETGSPKGFAFVEMGSTEAATRAVNELDQTNIGGRSIAISYQDLNRSRPAGNSSMNRGYNRHGGGGYGNRW